MPSLLIWCAIGAERVLPLRGSISAAGSAFPMTGRRRRPSPIMPLLCATQWVISVVIWRSNRTASGRRCWRLGGASDLRQASISKRFLILDAGMNDWYVRRCMKLGIRLYRCAKAKRKHWSLMSSARYAKPRIYSARPMRCRASVKRSGGDFARRRLRGGDGLDL